MKKKQGIHEDYKHMTKYLGCWSDTIKAELFSEYQWISAIYTYYTDLF